MPWLYRQSTGKLFHNDQLIATGYSGSPAGKNDASKQSIRAVGPIPQGWYTIKVIHDENGVPCDYEHKKAPVMHLIPDAANEMFGRDGFLIHGDSVAAPGTASEGCIIMGHPTRELVASSPDHRLQVVA